MAISNMYKPGWRSRRRSRLSLVERSVPRLGRMPSSESISKPEVPSNPAPALNAEDDQEQEIILDPKPQAPTELTESVTEQATQNRDNQLALRSPELIQGPVIPDDSEQIALRRDEDLAPEISNDHVVELELDTTGSIAEQTPLPDNPDHQVLPLPHIVPDAEHEATEPDEQLVLPKALEDSWDIESMSAAVQAKGEPAEVTLDWAPLIASGLVDPRDRTQPLPANVDEIARALIRQALSDQSSWRDRIILVSSARESRAKSMAALNFAFALTTIGRHSVALVDANMDGSGVGSHLKATGYPGLTTALCNNAVEVDEIALRTNLERLTLVGSGGFEDDILDRFASRRMLEILRSLTKDPDTLLVLDAPPILSSQEATVLSVIAGQVVLVVEAGTTDENSINHALKRIGDRHNVSLVLSHHSGITSDEPEVEETPASLRLALPKPKISTSRRRLKKAVASFAFGLGLSVLLGAGLLSIDQARIAGPSKELSLLSPSIFKIKPIAPQIGSVAQ